MTRITTQKQLDDCLKWWQKMLRLLDWEITPQFCAKEKMPEDAEACVEFNEHRKTAVLSVLNPDEYVGAFEGDKQDIEVSIVHELVHLSLIGWKTRSNAVNIQQEQAIESLSAAMVSLKRRRPTPIT